MVIDDAERQRYSIGELAEAGGVSRRAVRFYVQRGLVAPPHGVGRGAYYDASHLAQLVAIKRRQVAGEALEVIARGAPSDDADADGAPGAEPTARERWSRLVLAPGVELGVRDGALSQAQLAALGDVLRATLDTFDEPPHPEKKRSPR